MRNRIPQDTPRSGIRVGAYATAMGGWLVRVTEAAVAEDGSLRCAGTVISRPLMADTLAGERHPTVMWKV